MQNLQVMVCSDPGNVNTAAVWEINFSRSNESNKLEGFFVEEARERLRELEDVPEFDTQLTFVSNVGGRGVGKSTVTSLLSGNNRYFKVLSVFNQLETV